MAQILISNWLGKTIETQDTTKPLLRQLHDNHLDWMHACGGKGRCTTCKAIIIKGEANLTPLTPAEQRYLQMGALAPGERLACQVRVKGDITIAVAEEYKFPHIKYS